MFQQVANLYKFDLFNLILSLGGIAFTIFLIRRTSDGCVTVGRWFHCFDHLTASSMEIYRSLEETIRSKKMPNVQISQIAFPEGGFFSANRIYLRVRWHRTVFDICAAPFGYSFFISWQVKKGSGVLGKVIPFVGPRVESLINRKTFYQLDAEEAFKENMDSILQKTVDNLHKHCTPAVRDYRYGTKEILSKKFDRNFKAALRRYR